MVSPVNLLRFNSSRTRLENEIAAFAADLPAGSAVLDAGARRGPLPIPVRSCDLRVGPTSSRSTRAYGDTTYVCDLRSLPVDDDRFDAVVFSQVMEHLPDPDLVVAELRRVLRPGGRLFYSGPLFFEEHEQPYDFLPVQRRSGCGSCWERAGFELERLDWLEGYLGTVGYQLNRMARYLPIQPNRLGGGLRGVTAAAAFVPLRLGFAVLAVLFHRLELRAKVTDRGYPKNYVAVAVKPGLTDRCWGSGGARSR